MLVMQQEVQSLQHQLIACASEARATRRLWPRDIRWRKQLCTHSRRRTRCCVTEFGTARARRCACALQCVFVCISEWVPLGGCLSVRAPLCLGTLGFSLESCHVFQSIIFMPSQDASTIAFACDKPIGRTYPLLQASLSATVAELMQFAQGLAQDKTALLRQMEAMISGLDSQPR